MRHATTSMRYTLLDKTRWLLMLVALMGACETSSAQAPIAQTPSASAGSAQTTSPTKINLAFEKQLPDWLKETNVPAAGVAIIENGKLKYAKIFGELKRGVPAKTPGLPSPPANTIFQIASLTKPIVEVLALRLVTAGEWKLDEPLAKYWIDPDVQNDPRQRN